MTLLYLASTSPRRHALLTQLGYRIQTLAASIDETAHVDETADVYVYRMAQEKNHAARIQHQKDILSDIPIISADTTVSLKGQILGKPESPEHAFELLSALSGQVHQVLTSVCVHFRGQDFIGVQSSDVHFKTLSPDDIHAYIQTGEPMDKAGAYGIQGIAGAFVAHLSGSFTGVMGLPIFETVALLRECGYPTPPFHQP